MDILVGLISLFAKVIVNVFYAMIMLLTIKAFYATGKYKEMMPLAWFGLIANIFAVCMMIANALK